MIAALILAATLILVPHGDDEITMLPLIQDTVDVTVVIMTDGAATKHCRHYGRERCTQMRIDATTAFLTEVAPHAELIFMPNRDGHLTAERVAIVAINVCDGCDIWAAGSDYGHPDHDAVREGVALVGGAAYDGTLRTDPDTLDAVRRHYGWLLSGSQLRIVGLDYGSF